ncbi:MAG TPA: ComEC/Rec2 family competence protein, partial [Verrucomicrobiae bacterium]|nr:ComEC/Rec2 family competence protein [Verrucomicrobiae bacterium]
AIVFAGASALTLRTAVLSPFDIRNVVRNAPQIATIRGKLSETPFQRVYERGNRENWRTIAFINLDTISFGPRTNVSAFGTLAVSTTGILPSFYYEGQRVEVTGVIQTPAGPMAEGLFDYRKYLQRLGIYYQLQVGSTNDWRIVGPQLAAPLADRFINWAQGALALGLPEIDEPVRLLWAMALGWKTALTGEVSEPFMRSGTMHIFAISGLHIALIAAILVGVLRLFMLPRSACALVVLPLIWAYTGITGWQASAIRSTIMTSVVVAGWLIHRPSNLLNSLAAAALIILVWDPQQLFQAGFQLSFLVVLSLILFAPILSAWRERLLEPDPFLPIELRSKPEMWARSAARFLLSGITTSLAAFLGSMPIIAYYFHYLTPSSLIANLLVVPLSGFALASNMGSLAMASWFPACAELFNHAAWCFMLWMVRISEWSADLPAGCYNVQTPGVITFLLYYTLVVSIMAGWLKNPKWRPWCVGALLLLSGAWLFQWQTERSESRLSIVPVSGGEAIYLDHPKLQLLIDGGNEESVKLTTKPFLRAQGVNQLPALLLTDANVRQVGGAELLHELFSIKKVYASPLRFRSPAYRHVIKSFEDHPHLLNHLKRGDKLGPWTILHPDEKERFRQADDAAIVAFGEINGSRILLLSDLSRAGQTTLLARYPDLRADLVISGLPHGSEPVGDPLLEAANPRTVIITDSLYPASAHANRKLRERLRARKFDLWFTSDSGALTLRFKNGHYEIQPAIPKSPSPPVFIEHDEETDPQNQSEE